MFILTTLADNIRIPAHMLSLPTLVALHSEIDQKYPNRVLMDVGLVICRYGDCFKITNGTCVAGDGGSHHECLFRMVIFRPFVEEVCIGRIVKSTPDGIQVSLGFFQDIFIPAYWMLRPSHYDEKVGLWVWTPDYNEGEDDDEEEGEEENEEGKDDEKEGQDNVKGEDEEQNGADDQVEDKAVTVKQEDGNAATEEDGNGQEEEGDGEEEGEGEEAGEEGDRFEMEIGAEIRFKVKSIQFTQVTNTAKGVQATTTTTAHSHSFPQEQEEKTTDKPLRKRSTSVDLSESHTMPASMHIVASICEDGLGLTSWWEAGDDGEEEEEDTEEEGEGEEGAEEDGGEEYEEEYE